MENHRRTEKNMQSWINIKCDFHALRICGVCAAQTRMILLNNIIFVKLNQTCAFETQKRSLLRIEYLYLFYWNFGRRTDARKNDYITPILILGLFTSIKHSPDSTIGWHTKGVNKICLVYIVSMGDVAQYEHIVKIWGCLEHGIRWKSFSGKI